MTAPTLAASGLDDAQRELLGQALADAIQYRDPGGFCTACEDDPSNLCGDHASDLDKTDAYLALGEALGVEVPTG